VLECLGEAAVGDHGVRHSRTRACELERVEVEDLGEVSGGNSKGTARRTPGTAPAPSELGQQLLLRERVHRQEVAENSMIATPRPRRVSIANTSAAGREEDPEAGHQHGEADPLQRCESLTEDQQAANNRNSGASWIRIARRGARELQRQQVTDVIADQAEQGSAVQPPAAGVACLERQATAPGEEGPERCGSDREAVPLTSGIHAGERDLERDRQKAQHPRW